MVEVLWLGPVLSLLLLFAVIYLAIKAGKAVIWLIVNGILGIIAITLLNFFPVIQININFWSVLIAALGGIPGIILLILLDVFGIAF